MLLSEKLAEEEFPFIEFRTSIAGRLPYVKGSRLAVHHVVLVHRDLGGRSPAATARHVDLPSDKVAAALAYAAAHRHEIDPLVEQVETTTSEDLKRQLPWIERVIV
jgi:uncharacterized protein (DUF433 family)